MKKNIVLSMILLFSFGSIGLVFGGTKSAAKITLDDVAPSDFEIRLYDPSVVSQELTEIQDEQKKMTEQLQGEEAALNKEFQAFIKKQEGIKKDLDAGKYSDPNELNKVAVELQKEGERLERSRDALMQKSYTMTTTLVGKASDIIKKGSEDLTQEIFDKEGVAIALVATNGYIHKTLNYTQKIIDVCNKKYKDSKKAAKGTDHSKTIKKEERKK